MENGSKTRVYNKIYTDEEWEVVNKLNKDIVQDFLEEYTQRKMKKSTIGQYANNLRIVMIFINRFCENKIIFELSKRDFRKLSIWLSNDLHLSNARTNSVLSVCRSLLTYCEDSDDYEYDNNFAKKVKGLPKERVKNDEDDFFMSFDQIMRVRKKLLEMGEIQLAVLHMMLFDSGARRNEVAQVKKYNLLDGNKTNVVIGKRGKHFSLVYLDDTKELIREYLNIRGEDNVDSLWVIGSGDNKRESTYENLYDKVMKIREVLSELENKELNIFPHSYRHSRTEVLLQGTDTRIIDEKTGSPKKFSLEQVQVFLHHENPSTTQGYAKDHSEDLINEMFNF